MTSELQPPPDGASIADLLSALRSGATTPTAVVDRVADVVAARGDDGVWITALDRDSLRRRAAELEADPDARSLPLYGVPFAVKDSIDVAGLPTTCACPDYAYVPDSTAPVVSLLLSAGAVLVGKTNLDQFATGLNGTRTPYGVPRNVHGGDLIPGGSSSGSALAVATGQVPFAVATDTAGSGRVPAALNSIVGFKPSRGLLSTVGLVPACRSLDCMSLMARTVDDVRRVFEVVAAVDAGDPWSRPRQRRSVDRPRIGLPPATDLEFLGDDAMRRAHEAARQAAQDVGDVADVPLRPFLQAGDLLYQGPWVAERVVEFGDFLDARPDAVHPVVAGILEGGRRYSATDVFRAGYRLQELRAEVARLWNDVDVVVLPTVPTTFTVAQVLAEPVATNTALGLYTHCGNLLDLCAAVVPAGLTDDGRPCSLMVLGPALADDVVLDVAARLHGQEPSLSARPSRAPTVPEPAMSPSATVPADPAPFPLPDGKVALLVIDMQRDFLLPGGFGESLGNDVAQLQRVVPPLARVLGAAREAGLLVVHTREGHLPDLSDCPPAKLRRGDPSQRIGDPGPYGRILVRGEFGHDIVDELAPRAGEPVIDKPGKGAFYATDLQQLLDDHGITHLLVTGVTTEVCVHTTVREANDRGFDCLVLADCVGSYFPEFQRVGLQMVSAQGGIFGWVADSAALLAALVPTPVPSTV